MRPTVASSHFGDAGFFGSTGSMRLNRPVVGMAPTHDGGAIGWWHPMAGFSPSETRPSRDRWDPSHLNEPIVGMAPTHDGGGYWMVASDGGIFAFGDATFEGSLGANPPSSPIVYMAPTPDNNGYWLVSQDGTVYPFGDAGHNGSVKGSSAPVDLHGGHAVGWVLGPDRGRRGASLWRRGELRLAGDRSDRYALASGTRRPSTSTTSVRIRGASLIGPSRRVDQRALPVEWDGRRR